MESLLVLQVPEGFTLGGAHLERECDHLCDDGGSSGGVALYSPGDGPLEDDHDAHVSEGAEEEDLLWEPLEEEIDIIFEMEGVGHLEEDG